MILKSFLKRNAISNGIYFTMASRKAKQMLERRDEWEQMQEERLADLLNYAKKHSRYFWMHIGEKTITPDMAVAVLKTLPLLTKDIIREQQFNIYSDETGPKWKVWGNTGGSTGEPLKFPRLSNGQWNEPVCQWLTYNYLGGAKIRDIIVSVAGVRIPEGRIKSKIFYADEGNFPWGKYNFSTLYMTEENLPYYIEQLNKTKASFIRGYSAGVLTLAQYIKSHQSPLEVHLKGIYLTSEAFSEQSRDFISEVFHCPVIGQYGHTEMSVYAYQHKEDSVYECLPLYGYTEVLDDKGRHVKEDEVGEIVVTGFNQIGMPFIRYKTGDLATYKGTKNGIVYIDAIQGRTVDFLYDRDGKKVFLTGAIFGGHIKAFNYIAQWQLVQNEKGVVDVAIIKGDGFDETIEKEVLDFFEGFNIGAKLKYVDYIPKQANGKQKFLIQKCNE
jgi:phenylacetate-CoA ligase